MESIDIVDENDNVVASASREEVHRRGLLHRCVHVMLFDRSARLFLQRRSATVVLYPNLWTSSASGHVDAGESYEEAAVRELAEEIGVCADVRRVGEFRFHNERENERCVVFEAHFDGEVALDPVEVSDGRFVAMSELDAWLTKAPMDFSPSFVNALSCWKTKRASKNG